MSARVPVGVAAVVLGVAALCSCGSSGVAQTPPELAERGTAMTTATPSRQDLANTVSLAGTVTMDPVFGLVAPVGGEVRFRSLEEPKTTPDEPYRVGSVWKDGQPHWFEAPAGSRFAGRLVEDRSTVTAGMPVASVTHVGYGIVAEIDGDQAYRISGALDSVRAQIPNGPGPFPCTPLGTIAALPEGSVPADPEAPAAGEVPPAGQLPADQPPAGQEPPPDSAPDSAPDPAGAGSAPTGLRLVCTAPPKVKLINGVPVTLEVTTQRAKNALVVPVEAVAGGQGRGQVEVVDPNGSRHIVDVELGLTDGRVIEVRSGLSGDETLTVPGPDLPPAPPGEQGDPQIGGPSAVTKGAR
ncbi:efflux RND transporter periplasmic adaptor subunit [Actinophytocola xanthii]|uniref:Uncharacterized protein n=1 Tax=Actinophytocola xanthii TaxID=1912961 RepID=A0A1Q8CGS8_9PSEU|nr:hypothetical protein [Actinophytocola xanthii]OLF13544.1 hypothetical protein BU204_26970 [Actinophytocola xanthii]